MQGGIKGMRFGNLNTYVDAAVREADSERARREERRYQVEQDRKVKEAARVAKRLRVAGVLGETTNFSEVVSPKKLKGTPCDPNESVLVAIYSVKSKKARNQLIKRRNLIDKLCFYQGIDGHRYKGVTAGFYSLTGAFVVIPQYMDQPAPHGTEPQLVFIL